MLTFTMGSILNSDQLKIDYYRFKLLYVSLIVTTTEKAYSKYTKHIKENKHITKESQHSTKKESNRRRNREKLQKQTEQLRKWQ